MGMLSSFLHPGRAYDKAGQQSTQYYNQAQAQLQPYAQQGQDAYGGMNTMMQQLMNPAALQDEWASGYETSPYAQMLQEDATQQGMNAASSMGLMGSTPALQAIQRGTSMIGAQDRDKYMDSLMQKYMSGASMAGNIYNQGGQMAGQMGQNSMNQGQNMGQMAYGQQAAPGQLFGNLLGMGAGIAGSALGGPIGGAIAGKMFGGMGG